MRLASAALLFCVAHASALTHMRLPAHRPTLGRPRSRVIIAEPDFGSRVKDYWEGLGEFANAFKLPKLEEDEMPEAVKFNAFIDDALERPGSAPWGQLSNVSLSYYGAAWKRIVEAPDALPVAAQE